MSPNNQTETPTGIQLRTIQYLLASLVVSVWMVATVVVGIVPLAILLAFVSFLFAAIPVLSAAVRPTEE